THYLLRILVLPEPKKHGLTQAMISRPFVEFYLANEDGFDPMTELHFRRSHALAVSPSPLFRKIDKRTGFSRNFPECAIQGAEQLLIETGSDLSAKLEL